MAKRVVRMITVNLFDDDFRHSVKEDGFDTYCCHRRPTQIQYIRDLPEYNGVTLFTNEYMFSDVVDKVKTKHKVGWIAESPAIKPHIYDKARSVENKFDCILTCDYPLTLQNPKYKFIPLASTRFADDEIGLFTKTRVASHIVTNKCQTEGHILRHKIATEVKGFDVYRTPFDKVEAHKRYKFSIIVENVKFPGYFTEKIIDSIMMGAIPIYWGDPLISQWLDIGGIIVFDTVQDIAKLNFGRYEYENRYHHAVNNFNTCRKKYLSVDDNIGILLSTLYGVSN